MIKATVIVGLLATVCACSQAPESTPTEATAMNMNMTPVDGAAANTTTSSPAGGTDYSDKGKQAAWIEKGEDAIKAKLRDPDSAKFRSVEFHAGGGVPIACGEVNGNNGFGGKAGFERFVAASDTIAVLESEMTSSSDMDTVWNKFCRG